MQFLADARLLPGADIEPHLEAEIERIEELRDDNVIEHLFRRKDGRGAYLVMNGQSAEEIQDAIDSLPFVKLGLMEIPFAETERMF